LKEDKVQILCYSLRLLLCCKQAYEGMGLLQHKRLQSWIEGRAILFYKINRSPITFSKPHGAVAGQMVWLRKSPQF
jgi:hypothetical protein